jgi:hypothetical protein
MTCAILGIYLLYVFAGFRSMKIDPENKMGHVPKDLKKIIVLYKLKNRVGGK